MLRSGEVPPNGSLGGVVHVKKKKGDFYEVLVPFGEREFRFSISFE